MDFSRSGRGHRTFASLALGFACATPVWAEDEPGFDRPGLGFSTNPMNAGQFGYEQGLPDWSLNKDAGVTTRVSTFDSLLRLGVGSDLELQLGGSPYNSLRQTGDGPAQTSQGHGDTSLGLKWAPHSSSEVWTWGLLGTLEFNDGAPDFRSEQRVYTLGLVADQKFSEQVDVSYFVQWQRSGGKDNYLVAPDYNYQVNDLFGFYVEAAILRDANHRYGSQAGGGITFAPLPRLQFDTWFRHRLGGRAAEWEAGLGVAMYFGH